VDGRAIGHFDGDFPRRISVYQNVRCWPRRVSASNERQVGGPGGITLPAGSSFAFLGRSRRRLSTVGLSRWERLRRSSTHPQLALLHQRDWVTRRWRLSCSDRSGRIHGVA